MSSKPNTNRASKLKKERKKEKRKNASKIVLIIVLILAIAAIVFCVIKLWKGNSSPSVVGTWKYDESIKYIFNKDDTGLFEFEGHKVTFKYTFSDPKLEMKMEDINKSVATYNCSFSDDGNKLTVTVVGGETDGQQFEWTKQ